MKSLSTYLEEEKKEEKYKVVVLTRNPEENPNQKTLLTSAKFEKSAKSLGLDFYVSYINGTYLSFEDEVRRIHNYDDDEGFEISPKDTIVIVRGGVNRREQWKDMVSSLERVGYTCVNSRECMEICSDKYRTALRLAEVGLVTPTTVIVSNEKDVLDAFEKLDTEFPIILKTIQGTKGIGVLLIESKNALVGTTQLLFKIEEEISIILQNFLETDGDVRVMVLNHKIIGSMKREKVKGDFRSNVHLGAKVEKYELTDKEKSDCIRAAKAVNGTWVGVDFIPAKDRDNDSPFILEVNSSPGTEGFDKATNGDVVKDVLVNFYDRDNWWTSPSVAGVWETFEHKKIGKLIGKMDTGNSSKTSVIHADKYEIKDKKVIWEINGTKLVHPIEKIKDIELGGLRNRKEQRPAIKMDFTFSGVLYKDMDFTIDDRGEKTPLLINRLFMKTANLMVDPSRKFILTEKI